MPSQQTPPLSILTFNLLAPCYKRLYSPDGAERRDRERNHPHLWTARLDSLLTLLLSIAPRPHVIALQEVWFHPPFLARLEAALTPYFQIFYAKRPARKEDGLATLIRRPSPTLPCPAPRKVAAFPLADADRVGLAVSLTLPDRTPLLVVNAHLSFPHSALSRRLRAQQADALVAFVSSYLSRADAPVNAIVLGDFNGDPSSQACKRLSAAGFVNCYAEVNGPAAHPPTHFNHMHQQVFVDHVFLRSNLPTAAQPSALVSVNAANAIPRRKRRTALLREEQLIVKEHPASGTRRSRVPSAQPRSVSPSPVAIRDINKTTSRVRHSDVDVAAAPLSQGHLRAVSTVVYPERFPTDFWPNDFDISDHRPVLVQFRCSDIPA